MTLSRQSPLAGDLRPDGAASQMVLRACRRTGPGMALAGMWLLLLMVSGCAILRDVPEPVEHRIPAAPVPATWEGDTAAGTGPAEDILDLEWTPFFSDKDLQSVIETALDNNRDLRLAALRVSEARATYEIQLAETFPILGATGQAARARLPGDLNISGRPVTSNQFETYLGLSSWEVDFWGRIESLSDAALQSYFATEAGQRGAQLALIAQTAKAWLTLSELDARTEIARRTLESRRESFRIFRLRNEMGSTSRLDLTQVETLYVQAEILVTQLEQARALQAHYLDQVSGAIVSDTIIGTGRLHEIEFPDLVPGIPSDILVRRPDILAAEFRLKAAQANIDAARAAFFPRIALTGNLGVASTDLEDLFRIADSNTWSFVPSVSVPLFEGGRLRNRYDIAEIRRDAAVAAYEKALQEAFRDVADALTLRRGLDQQFQLMEQAVTIQQERTRLALMRYDNGAAAYLEVLDSERDLLSAEQQLAQIHGAQLASHVALFTALGGGTEVPELDTPDR